MERLVQRSGVFCRLMSTCGRAFRQGIFIVTLLSPIWLGGQSAVLSGKENKLLLNARQQLKAKDYKGTLKTLSKLNQTIPEVMLVYGLLADEQKNKAEAVSWFLKVFEQAPHLEPKLPHYLGVYYYELKEYTTARSYFEKYLNSPATIPGLVQSSRAYLEKLVVLEGWMAQGSTLVISPIPGKVNTGWPEYLPVVTADSQMLFIRRQNQQEDLFLSKYEHGQWQSGDPLLEINTPQNEGAASISADGQWLVFTGCDRQPGAGSCDLYIAERTPHGWSKPQPMGDGINTPSWEAQPTLNHNGSTMIFSSNRPGGSGGRDLWFTRKNGRRWTTPVNLGKVINTSGDEETPFLHPDGQTIYFASTGHQGIGGADLFMTSWSESQRNWTTPMNLGYPINTPANEGGLVVALDGQTAFFTRDTLKSAPPADLDIYTFRLPASLKAQPMTYLRLQVVDASTGQPVRHHIYVLRLESKDTLISSLREEPPVLVIKPAANYLISIQSEGYLPYSGHLSYDQLTLRTQPVDTTIQLLRVIKDKESTPIVLRNIFFVTGSADLLPASYPELEILKGYLLDHPSMRIEIRGHTDNTGEETFNQNLSMARAKVVHDYLLQQGVPAVRLSYKGYGSNRPVAENNTTSGRTLNRRTEFVILTDEQKK